MPMTTKTKLIRVMLGALTGALITGAFAAFLCWIVVYTDPRSDFLGPTKNWAPVAAIVGGICGSIAGAGLGMFLSAVQHGPLFSALYGAIGGLAVSLLLMVQGIPDWDSREGFFVAALVPLGALSGFLTSPVISVITSRTEQEDESYVLLNLRQNKAKESRSS